MIEILEMHLEQTDPGDTKLNIMVGLRGPNADLGGCKDDFEVGLK